MLDHSGPGRDLRSFALSEFGQLLATGDVWEPYRLVDQHGLPVEPVAAGPLFLGLPSLFHLTARTSEVEGL